MSIVGVDSYKMFPKLCELEISTDVTAKYAPIQTDFFVIVFNLSIITTCSLRHLMKNQDKYKILVST